MSAVTRAFRPPAGTKMFQGFKLGDLQLKHRIVMAPLTRCRAHKDGIPTDLHALYYAQRATEGGLIITEATNISKQAIGYKSTPGVFTAEQKKGWQLVTNAVHEKKGFAFLQLWHTGRVAKRELSGTDPVGPSPISVPKMETPKELSVEEIDSIVRDYKHAAGVAKEPGISGGAKTQTVELPHLNIEFFRQHYDGNLITCGDLSVEDAHKILEDGSAELVAFGRNFISNPDLPERIRLGAELLPNKTRTIYGPGPEGYTDYPALTQEEKKKLSSAL